MLIEIPACIACVKTPIEINDQQQLPKVIAELPTIGWRALHLQNLKNPS
jgi:hypothetical protein